jgi:hypothetical protein
LPASGGVDKNKDNKMELSNWAPEHSDALREFLAKGMSYSEAARAINSRFNTFYTRSAALGRARRLGGDRGRVPVERLGVEGTALLVVQRGPNAGSRFLLDSDVTTAGRHPNSDIFLDDVTVSRHHVEFYRRGNSFGVRDVGSLNGTYVNRERIDEAELGGGDEVQIGKFRLVLVTKPR